MTELLICVESHLSIADADVCIFDPRVEYSMWVYDCPDIECKLCYADHRHAKAYGIETLNGSIERAEDAGKKFALIHMPYPGTCTLCDERTETGFAYGCNDDAPHTQHSWCCDNFGCISYTVHMIEGMLEMLDGRSPDEYNQPYQLN
jgi:hypothetical protein